MPLIQGTGFVWSACTVKIIRLKISVSNLNYDTSQLHTLSFSSGKIFTKSKLGSHKQHTPHMRAKWSNKEGDYTAIVISMGRGFLQSLLRSLRLGLGPDRALRQLELFTQYGAV